MGPAGPEVRMRVGMMIKRRRQVLGWNQQELADRVGVHVNSVQKWEAGTHYPGRKLGRVEAVLGIDLSDEPPEPEVSKIMLDMIDLAIEKGELPAEDRQLLIDHIKQFRAGEQRAAPPSVSDRSGRHRRAPA